MPFEFTLPDLGEGITEGEVRKGSPEGEILARCAAAFAIL